MVPRELAVQLGDADHRIVDHRQLPLLEGPRQARDDLGYRNRFGASCCRHSAIVRRLRVPIQRQFGRIGLLMDPIKVTERLGRWSAGRGPLYVLLAARLRQLIDDGELPPGTRLPPDRVFASALAVGRSTVVAAYDLLHGEGRIVRRQGSGTRVAGPATASGPDTTAEPMFLDLLEPRAGVVSLACAAPDTPPPELIEAYTAILPALARTTDDMGYHPAGHSALRRAIASRFAERGVPTEPAQILVTTGGQQALSLLARAFSRPGDRVLVEAPTHPGALEVFREAATVLRGLPPGLAGFATAVREHRPALAYVIPTFHNPTGAVLTALERARLAEMAVAQDIPVIDDEVLAELGFPGVETPLPLAAYMDNGITTGSLSKTIWGGLRIGWIRADAAVVGRMARLRAVHDLGGNLPAQLAAAELLPLMGKVLRRTAVERQQRHDHLRAELGRLLPEWPVPPVTGGQTLWVCLPRGDGTSFTQIALRHGVSVLPGSGLDPGDEYTDHIRLHFMHPPEVLSRAAERLADAWRDYRPPAHAPKVPSPLAI
ncbi:aminotransferase class I/II-fold pyridoxal phosphate-dependent enzyme [Nocardia arthritidis]|uniref:Aminotransferase class I/II-fold pyridoxal phosphate-dependent enzyme n=2 Tax=Nocardia arthritidis TaxID=228602 RepID=A0A6G9YTX1_9NOCA|nr:aminotransferase class I/II-fold pyridoxal phosphate-dependent enzyme [Nocardia arthritidis]